MHKFLIAALLGASAIAAPATAAERTDPRSEAALSLYRDLIAFRTAEGQGQVPAMAARLTEELKAAGFIDADITVQPMGETAYLLVRYAGTGEKAPIAFLGHMDVVDALPEDWERDPFTLTEDGDYFYGRGTIDNKLGIAMLTRAFAELKQAGFSPDRDLYLAFSGDEETGMQTTKALVEALSGEQPAFALNSDAGGGVLNDGDGSPLAYMVQVAEKTFATFDVTVRNEGGHSSRPRPDNAIYELADILKKVEAYQFPVQSNAVTREFFAATGESMGGEAGAMLTRFAENPDDPEAAAAIAADPSMVGFTRTTCVATMLDAGHAENALPQRATATVNCRIFPGTEVSAVQTTLAEVGDNPDAQWVLRGDPTTSPVSDPRDDVNAAVAQAVHARYPDLPLIPYMESGGTDGMHFRVAGIPTYAVSSRFMRRNQMFAHGLDERMRVDSFFAGLEHWPTIIRALASE
ncbi:M20/M25/M40 family metallo-hydrolase [Pacificimonas flava]|uniref:M20/M25/M40 family peptidase n=1 Tax=Pacificimonas flava TaxID=1234595 RepID=M2U2P5_9SPHN|nr:M20/M25/M40 family metallo-hydrolase [Pacificimonas flava]EMD82242.1 M20/M25/M40 family peptidase [Pacificimonas flava]MBB5280848.1 acetylornithine deacetylase/succinyl-diaminopimelate desuccinylase-like protein [Pacificimonas flava]